MIGKIWCIIRVMICRNLNPANTSLIDGVWSKLIDGYVYPRNALFRMSKNFLCIHRFVIYHNVQFLFLKNLLHMNLRYVCFMPQCALQIAGTINDTLAAESAACRSPNIWLKLHCISPSGMGLAKHQSQTKRRPWAMRLPNLWSGQLWLKSKFTLSVSLLSLMIEDIACCMYMVE
jgi:hypothetical protein